jgi:methylmalonyl-CoA/ethylmalonyl-CoA epimerase
MELKFSHVDILVENLDLAVSYYKKILGCIASERKIWNRDGFHVEYAIMFNGEEKFFLVQPITGNLKTLLTEKGEGTIYRLCYTVPDILKTFDELINSGVQPENENGNPISKENLVSPNGKKIIWLPKKFGSLSIEILQEDSFKNFIESEKIKAI